MRRRGTVRVMRGGVRSGEGGGVRGGEVGGWIMEGSRRENGEG